MAYQHVFPSSVVAPLFLYLQDRDLWRWELPSSREISAALEAHGFVRDFRAGLPFVEDARFASLTAQGEAIRLHIGAVVAEIADHARRGPGATTPAARIWRRRGERSRVV